MINSHQFGAKGSRVEYYLFHLLVLTEEGLIDLIMFL